MKTKRFFYLLVVLMISLGFAAGCGKKEASKDEKGKTEVTKTTGDINSPKHLKYEMKGENRLAADAYITAFNLRPGDNTLYWIENGVFHTSIKKIVPYLQTFLKNEQ